MNEQVDVLIVLMEPPDEHVPNIQLGRLLEAAGFTVGFVSQLTWSARKIRAAGLNAVGISEELLADTLDAASEHLADAESVESKYALISLRDLCLPEVRAVGTPESLVLQRGCRYLQRLETIFELWKPRWVVQNSGAELLRRTTFQVARRRGVKHVFIYPTPFKHRVAFSVDSEAGDWTEMAWHAEESVGPASISSARAFVEEFRRQKLPVAEPNLPRPNQKRLEKLIKMLRVRIGEKEETMGRWGPVGRSRAFISSYLKSQVTRRMYTSLPTDTPFLFYPVHVWLDSAITVRAPQFINQHHVVTAISDAMPQGHLLCVKEHPLTVGQNPLPAMLAMSRLPNVRILNPMISSHEAAERARAVVVINSTAGFDSLAYHKPVVVLGNPFYSRRGITFDVDALFDLRFQLKRALHATVDRDQTDCFINAAYKATWPGTEIVPGGEMEALSASLLAYLERDQVRPVLTP